MTASASRLACSIIPADGFAESTSGEDDAVLRARLEEDGYLFVRGLVAPSRLMRVRRLVLELCREDGWLADGSDPMDGVPRPGLVILEPEARYQALYLRLIATALFNALATAPETMALFRRLLSDDVFVHPRNIARVIFPGGETTQPHQDFRYIGGAEDTYTAWLPLGDCPRKLGSLAVLERSHRRGELPHQPAIGAGGNGIRTDDLGLRWLASDFRCGDMVLFHSRTVHAGLDSLVPDRLRLSADFRYQRAGDPVRADSLLPHYHEQFIEHHLGPPR